MTKVTIHNSQIEITIQGTDKLWSLKSQLRFPLSHVRGATVDPDIATERHGWRGPGTFVPGVVTAGTFHQDGERIFIDVHDPTKVIVVQLEHEQFERLVIEVEDPRATVAAIESAIGRGNQ